MAAIKPSDSDFGLRAMEVLVAAALRQLQSIDADQIKKIAEKLGVISDEALATKELKEGQKNEYEKINAAINEQLAVLERMDLQDVAVPALEIKQKVENRKRKQLSEQLRRAQAQEEQEKIVPE